MLNHVKGLEKLLPTPQGALEQTSPIRVVQSLAKMVGPLYLCIDQSIDMDGTREGMPHVSAASANPKAT